MPSEFNPYREWLGVDVPGQTPNYYQLLGVADFEANPEALWAAAYQRRALLRAQQYGERPDVAKRLLDEVDAAEACLLNPGRKTDYDKALRSGEAPPLSKASSARAGAPSPEEKPAAGSKSRRDRRLKPGEKETSGRKDAGGKEDRPPEVAEVPPARDPVADPIADARPTGPKSAWGYDEGVAFHPEVLGSKPAGNPAPLAMPKRPEDFLPPPAAPSTFGSPPGFAPTAGYPPPAGFAPPPTPPMAGLPAALPPAGWAPAGPPSPPMAGTVHASAVPGYPVPTPGYSPAPPYGTPPAQPSWSGAPMAAAPVASPYPTGAVPAAPMGAPYGAAPYGAAPMAAVPNAVPMAAAAPMAAPMAAAAPAMSDDFDSPGPGSGAAAGPVVSGAARRNFAKRPTPSVYALGGFLAAVIVGVVAIMVINRPSRDDRKVTQNPPEKTLDTSLEHKSSIVKTPVTDPPAKTGNPIIWDDPPGKTESKKPPKTEPMKEPAKTEPMKEPSKEPPMTKEKPKGEPKEKPKGDAQRDALVTAALMSARYYLSERDLNKAKDMISLAKKNDVGGMRQEETERVRLLSHYVGEFWKAVKDECKGLDGGAVLTIQGITIAFVEGNNDYVMFRRAGRNEKHYFFPSANGPTMKTGLAQGLAELYLAKNNTVTHLILGAFKTVNSTSERSEAKQHFETAQSMGTNDLKQTARLMLPELAVSIPKEAPKLPDVPGTPSTPNPEPSEGKPKPPTGDALVKAQDAIKAKFKQQLAAAVFDADKAVVAEKLHGAAETEELDPAGKYALLVQARDLAAEGRRPKLALEIVADIDQHFTIDVLTMRVETLAIAVKGAGDDADVNKDIAQTASTLADDAALMEKFTPAIRLAGIALQAARKAKDPELLKQAIAREKEIKALKPGKT